MLQRARREAARDGASSIELEHVARALTACNPAEHDGAPLPNRIGPRLAAALTRIDGAVGVEELRRLSDRYVRP